MEEAGRKESGGNRSRKSLSPNKDDSLTDFKSPRQEPVAPSKVKIAIGKGTKKSSSKGKISGKKKKEAVVKEVAQPSIESSFFKAATNGKRDGHTCPLCMKYFADTSAGTSHTKSCAAKNKVSTKKLLAAVALQERQTDERIALGLPSGPIVQPKDKTPRRPREPVAKGDPDLQLALALSKSLQEKQIEQEFEEAILLAGEHRGDGRIVGFSSDSERRRTLKNFGFLTNKPIGTSDGPIRTRRKKHLGPTILQTRSQEARDRLLTERIAEILMGNEAITQVCQQEITAEAQPSKNRQIVLRSRLLKEIHRTTERLWDTAQLSTSVTNFYVENLAPVIVPIVSTKEESTENSAADSNNTEETDIPKEEAAFTTSEKSPLKEDDRLTEIMSESSEELGQINKSGNDKLASPRTDNIRIADRQYRNTLSMDWTNTLNVSSMSDVVVLVEKGHIWAHKLVFYVRCSDILLDCEVNSDAKFYHVKEKISWLDVDLPTGLAFLEFVYSGLIEKNVGVFSDDRVASGVRRLARKYRLKPLFDYLRRKQTEYDRVSGVTEEGEARTSGLRSPIVVEEVAMPSKVEIIQENSPANAKSKDAEEDRESSPSSSSRNLDDFSTTETSASVQKIVESNSQSQDTDAISIISVPSNRSYVSLSPDLFDETTEEATMDTVKNAEHPDLTENDNSNLKALDDLMAQDDFSSSADASARSTATTVGQDRISTDSQFVDATNEISSMSQGQLETPRSRSNSMLGGVAKIKDKARSQLFSEKPKSNLSLFIAKVQKINAKAALDSYSESESLSEPVGPRRRKNPFNVNNISDDSISDYDPKLNAKRGPCRKEKRGLSIFDEPVELKSATETNTDKLAPAADHKDDTSQAEESSVIDDTTNTENDDISVYSKYRKSHKRNNSISRYRNMLKELADESAATEDDEESVNLTSLSDKPIDLTQETDSDVDLPPSPMSSTSGEKKGLENASDNDSIHSASTIVVDYSNSNATGDDEKAKDSDTAKASSAASSSKRKSDEDRAKGKKNSEILHHDCDNSLSESPSKKKTKEDKTKRASSGDDLSRNRGNVPEYSIDTTPESTKSPRNSPRCSDRYLLEVDDDIFAQSWNSQTWSSSPSSSARPAESSSTTRKRKSEQMRTKNDLSNDLEKNEEEAATNKSTAKSPKNSTEFPELDVFEIDEEMFAPSLNKTSVSQRKSLMPSPQHSFDYSDRSATSRRKRRAEERISRETSFADHSKTKSPANTSEYPDIDVDELFTHSFRKTDEAPRRSLTPVKNRSLDAPGKSASSRSKRGSNGDRRNTRESFVDDLERNKSNESLAGERSLRNASEFHYEVFEPDDNVLTQSFNSPRQSPDRMFSPSPKCASSSKDNNRGTMLSISSPIVISSSPEFDVHNERNVSNDERSCNKENRLGSARSSPLSWRKSPEAISPANLERSALFSSERFEIPVDGNSPTNLERSTTPQPGSSRKYSSGHRGDFSNSAKSPFVRWNSMPANSSNAQINRKRSRTPKNSSRIAMSQDVTPPVNYDLMGTPELKDELAKYGLKPQKRHRARKLLTHIYNQLHPVVPISSLDDNVDDCAALSDDDEPPVKKIGKPSNRTSGDCDADHQLPEPQRSETRAASVIPEEMDFADGNASSDDSDDATSTNSIKKAFNALIKEDKEIHNKILTYEPLPLDLLYLMLKARGLKCKCKDLMDFLDEECITFQVQAQRSRSNKTRGKKTARGGRGKANILKS